MKPELRTTVLVLALMAAACGDSKTAEQGTAAGEVLPGSISDAMLPLDSVRSEPPLADPVEVKGVEGVAVSKGGKATASPTTAASESPAAQGPPDVAAPLPDDSPTAE